MGTVAPEALKVAGKKITVQHQEGIRDPRKTPIHRLSSRQRKAQKKTIVEQKPGTSQRKRKPPREKAQYKSIPTRITATRLVL